MKREALLEHDVLKLNVGLLGLADVAWTDAKIRSRNDQLAKTIIEIWPVPPEHKSGFGRSESQPKRRVSLADLIGAGLLASGTVLYARPKMHKGQQAIVLSDGRIDVGGSFFDSPSGVARFIKKRKANGWWFFNVGQKEGIALAELLQEYVDQTSDDDQDLVDEDDGEQLDDMD